MADEETTIQSLEFLPENLYFALLDFQRDGVRFGIGNKGRCLIGDEMGLGKTLQAISIAYFYKDEWPMLIVVPSSMKYPWIEEIEKWVTDLEPGDINLIRSGTDISNIPTSKISIIGYGLCGDRRSSKLLVNTLKEQAFKVIIMDESHYLKNRNAGRTKLLHPISMAAKRVILLTGTPSLARPEELYIQLDIVRPGVFGSFSDFANRYCEAHYEDMGKFRKWNTRGACRLDELHKRLSNGIMIRRLKKNVLKQLPPKRRQKITFELPESVHKRDLFQAKAEYRKHFKSLENKQLSPQMKSEALFQINRLSTVLYHYTGIAKAGSVQHYIADLLDGMDNKFLVFCRHKQVITAVIQQLSKKHAKYIHIDGSVPSSVRGSLVKQFQNNAAIRVAVLAIEAASFGLTLTAADHVVFAELHYTPGVMMQAEDRAHRIGQVNAVNVHYLVGKGTLDEVLWGMLRKKIYVTSATLDGKLAELHADEGDEEKSKQLSVCAAWLREETEENDEDLPQGYLFSQKPKKSKNQIEGQKDVRHFFTPPITGSRNSEVSILDSDEEMMEIFSTGYKTESKENTTISIGDSSEEDNVEYDEEELANMLLEKNYSSRSNCSSNKSYIGNDMNANDDDVDVQMEALDESPGSGSSDINEKSLTENADFERNPLGSGTRKEGVLMDSSKRTEQSVVEVEEELEKTNADSIRRTTKRNPFSLKNKGAPNTKKLSSKSIQSDSGEDSVALMPKFSPKPKKEREADTSNQDHEDTLFKNPSTIPIESTIPTINPKHVFFKKKRKCIPQSRTLYRKTSWSCEACTFINDPRMIECSICFSPRHKEKTVLSVVETITKDHPASNNTIENSQEIRVSHGQATVDKIRESGVESLGKCCAKVDQGEDTSSGHLSGTSTNKEDTNTHSECSILCGDDTNKHSGCSSISKDDRSSVDVFQLSEPLGKPEGAMKEGAVIKLLPTPINDSPTNLCDDEDDFRELFLQWPCSACTFLNDSMLNECSICLMPKRRSRRKTKSQWSTWSCEKRRRERTESGKRRFSRHKVEKLENKMGMHAGIREEQEINCRTLDIKIEDTQEASKSTTESRKRTQTRKKLNLGYQGKGTPVVFEKRSSADAEKVQMKDESDDSEGKHLKESKQIDSKNSGQECTVTKETSGQEHDETEEDPFILEFSDSDAMDDDKEICDKKSNGRSSPMQVELREGSDLDSTTPQTIRREDIVDKSEDDKHVLSVEPREGSDLDNVAQKTIRGEDIVDKSEDEKHVPSMKPRDGANTNNMTGQQTTTSEQEIINEDGGDIIDGLDSTSLCSNAQYTKPRDGTDSTTMAVQQTTTSEQEVINDDSFTSITNKPNVEESLQELQEAAELFFAGDEDVFEQLDTIELLTHEDRTGDTEIAGLDHVGQPTSSSIGDDALDADTTKPSDVVVRKPKDPPKPVTLRFSLSLYTDRVYVYDEEDHYLQTNFTMSDVKNNNKEELPHLLQHEHNFKQAKRMVQVWDRLGIQQKRILSKSKLVFKNPFEGYRMTRALKSEESTNVRHPNKKLQLQKIMKAALEVGGQVRLVTKSPAIRKRKRSPTKNDSSSSNVPNTEEGTNKNTANRFSCAQAFGPDGKPLCLFCRAPVDYGALGNKWDSRFCSHDCKENHQIRTSSAAVRRNLFDVEQGVCQLCQFDAHACFKSVKSLQKKDRRAFIEKSVYSDLSPQLLNRMIVDPKEGMFWEADHIVAVVEGGGECGMDNFRTLCVPCHQKVTKKLLGRLRTKRQRLDVTGSKSITTFLESKS